MAFSSRTCSLSFLLFLFFLSYIFSASGGKVGVDYGRDADNLIPPERVVQLLKDNGIGAAAIYDADPGVIQAFSNSGIKLRIALRNELLANAAGSKDYAGTWVRDNVGKFYPATQIDTITVGNEVFQQRSDLTGYLVPAMQNVYDAVASLGYADRIKITTPIAFSAVSVSFPPSKGSFRDELKPVLRQILDFLSRTGSSIMVNYYPYIAYRDNYPTIPLDYTLGQLPNAGVRDPNSGLMYYRLLDAQLDAVYSAMKDLGYGIAASPTSSTVDQSLQQQRQVSGSSAGETGMPSSSRRRGGRSSKLVAEEKTGAAGAMLNASMQQSDVGISVENAQAYNNNLVQRILSGRTGTPLHPNADLDVYIFSLFNENRKPGPETERNFGLFYPDGRKVYDVSFRRGGGGDSWCVADPAVGRERMQAALDWACGPQGQADCGPIQPGAACYEPNTVEAHASYAMNSYYQRRGRGDGTCNFNGAGRIVYQRPRYGNCELPSSAAQPQPVGRDSWCVADPAAGRERMQAALDWACGQGRADCGPIQQGAPCYEPNTVEAHASYAMNSYYQRRGRGDAACNFNGVGRVVYQRPRYGNCELPSSR